MKYLLLVLLFLLPAAAHAQSCTPNNNGSFSINGSTLSGSGLLAQQYTAGIAVNMTGVNNPGTCYPVTITGQSGGGGGTGPVLVQAVSSNPNTYWIFGTGSCTWTVNRAIASGNTVMGYGHFSNYADNAEEYPTSVTDNVGNTYTLGPGLKWQPYPEDIGMWYLTNVQGNPTSFTFHFADASTQYSCNVGLAEYSGSNNINALVGPVTNASSPDPSITITPTATSLIWAFGAPNPISSCLNSGQQGSMETSGYSLLIDNCRYDGLGLWGSNSTVAASPQTLTWNNHDYWNATVCADASSSSTGCSTLMMAAAIGGSAGGGGGTPTITVNGSSSGATVSAGASVTVAVANGPGNPRDWVGLCTDTTTCNTYSDWTYINGCTKTAPASGVTSATCTLTAFNGAGSYFADFYPNNLHSNILASAPFTVSGGTAPTITVNGSSSGTTVSAGSSLNIAVANGPSNPADWVSVCNAGAPLSGSCDGAGYSWDYIQNCSHTRPTVGVASATCTLTAPSPSSATTYAAQFLANNGYTSLASAPFTVTGTGGGGGACTSSVGGPSPAPCPSGMAAPAGYHWDLVFYDNFTQDSSLDGNRWYITSPESFWCCDGSLGVASTPAWSVLADLYSKYQRQFGFWEVAFQAPNDASGGSDGRHEDINFNVGQGSCRAELDFFEKTIGQSNGTSALGSYTDDPSNSCIYSGGFYNTPDGSCFCAHSHTIGLNWANDGNLGTISGYIDGQLFIGPHTLVTSNWLAGAGMGIDLFDKACAVDGSGGFGGGGTCNQSTWNTSGDPFWYQYARIWRLVAG